MKADGLPCRSIGRSVGLVTLVSFYSCISSVDFVGSYKVVLNVFKIPMCKLFFSFYWSVLLTEMSCINKL